MKRFLISVIVLLSVVAVAKADAQAEIKTQELPRFNLAERFIGHVTNEIASFDLGTLAGPSFSGIPAMSAWIMRPDGVEVVAYCFLDLTPCRAGANGRYLLEAAGSAAGCDKAANVCEQVSLSMHYAVNGFESVRSRAVSH
jgi:hypothetical protein